MTTSLDWITYRPCGKDDRAGVGTVIGSVPCHACGAPATVKLNRNLIAYCYCHGMFDAGEPCSGHMKWGRAASQRIIATWAKGVDQGEVFDAGTEAVDQAEAAPAPAAEPEPKPARKRGRKRKPVAGPKPGVKGLFA